jgi:hypothetical protein
MAGLKKPLAHRAANDAEGRLSASLNLTEKCALFGKYELALFGRLEISTALRVRLYASSILFVVCKAFEGDQSIGDVVGAFIWHPIAEQIEHLGMMLNQR